MLQFVVAAGLFLWLMKEGSDQAPDRPPSPEPSPEPSPTPELRPMTSWVIEGTVEGYRENVVWMVDFENVRGTPDGTFFVIGNLSHTGFLRANSDRGTIDIPSSATGGTIDQDNVIVYPSLADAQARLEELANPTPTDPNDPTQPQRPDPEEEEDDDSGNGGGFGGLPSQGGLQLGQNGGYVNMGM